MKKLEGQDEQHEVKKAYENCIDWEMGLDNYSLSIQMV